MGFVADKELSAAIKRVCGGENLRIACAFWGTGAAEFLGDRAIKHGRFIAELTMGGTNPQELRNLGVPNERIKTVPLLHAKVFISSIGCVVGSANISNNGVGWLDKAGLIEAGSFVGPSDDSYSKIEEWFEGVFNGALPVDELSLAECERKWNARQKSDRSAVDLGDISNWGVVLPQAVMAQERREELMGQLEEQMDEQLGARKYIVLEGWTKNQIENWPEYFVELTGGDRLITRLRRKVHVINDCVYAQSIRWNRYFSREQRDAFEARLQENINGVNRLRGQVTKVRDLFG